MDVALRRQMSTLPPVSSQPSQTVNPTFTKSPVSAVDEFAKRISSTAEAFFLFPQTHFYLPTSSGRVGNTGTNKSDAILRTESYIAYVRHGKEKEEE